MSTVLFDPIKTMATISDTVLVSFSGGKESIVVLDLCMRYFKHVHVLFQVIVPNLDYEEKILTWYEKKYGIEIIRAVGECAAEAYRYGYFRPTDLTFPIISETDFYNYYRVQTGSWFVASGERVEDSLQRRAMIKHSGTINVEQGRFYPVALWKKKEIYDYIKYHKLYLHPAQRELGFSLTPFGGRSLKWHLDNHPEDYYKIIKQFPFAGAYVTRKEQYGKNY